VVNENKVPGDKGTTKKPYGIRLGSPAVTTREMGPGGARRTARWLIDVLTHPKDETLRSRIRAGVIELYRRFPVYAPTF
jgi:glycine hydroxymethyltransferase